MNRVRDYSGFAAWFAGLGYIVLWPVTSSDLSGRPFGASIFCRDGAFSVLDFLCNSPHPLQLPPALHAIGLLSAIFVTARLLLHAVRRSRRAADRRAAGTCALTARIPAVVLRPPPPRKPPRRYRTVKPRRHFGLRGLPQ